MNICITEKPARASNKRTLVRVVIVGHVDHGKSTLIGRLLHETGSLPDGKLDSIRAVSDRRGMGFEWSFLLDALQTERDLGITLDTSQIRVRMPSRDIVLIDAPGHAEFLRNMITGAAQAEAALLVIDATEGLREQTRRHCYLLHLLGIHQIAVVINKMDRAGFDEGRFHEIEAEIVTHLATFGLTATAIIPISAKHGDGVAKRTPAIAWHTGPTVLEALERFAAAKPLGELALRIPVQAVYKFDERRIIAGRVETGRVAIGDEVVITPRGMAARVQSIEAWPPVEAKRRPSAARAGQSIGLTLDRQIFVERGDLIAAAQLPAKTVRRLRARVFWLHEQPLAVGSAVGVRVGMAQCRGVVALIDGAVDPGILAAAAGDTGHESAEKVIAQNHVGEIEIALPQPIAADIHAANPRTGRLVLELGGRIAGGGLILSIDGDDSRKANARRGERDRIAAPIAVSGEEIGFNKTAAEASRLSGLLTDLAPAERIARFRNEVDGRMVFTTSFGLEDQVILHLISEHAIDADIMTIDTGRLFPETYDLWADTERRYGRRIRAIYPQHQDLESLIEKHGINGFYDSRDARTACCHARKVEPLERALAGAAGWIVGLRADQSSHRRGVALVTADRGDVLKLSPLFDWTRDAVFSFTATNQVPISPLHARAFASIGCAPCTRAIAPGEPERAGRWWWEQDEKKECGLHGSSKL
jgi:phosphoadenylyl-sulfate reductase (thioredoxin)